jgi:hypothetical protein
MKTRPSFSMSIFTPVSAMILLITLPPGPITLLILSGSICMTIMRGANSESSGAASAIVSLSLSMMNKRDFFASVIASRMMAIVMPCDLDVHLNRRDAVDRAGDLEVHLAERVFDALDVGEDRVLLAVQHEAHRDARDVLLDRHARVHERERRAADRRHRRRAVGFERFADQAQRVGEFLDRRQQRHERAFREVAVADFAPARARIGRVSPTEYGGKL